MSRALSLGSATYIKHMTNEVTVTTTRLFRFLYVYKEIIYKSICMLPPFDLPKEKDCMQIECTVPSYTAL